MNLKSRFALWLVRRKVVAATGLKGRDKRMLSGLLKNWQTSVLGIVMAALQLHQGGMSWGSAAMAALMAALGLAAKDGNKTGL